MALVCYEKLLPGSQLVNRLRDLGYRVEVVAQASSLPAVAEREKPLIVLADLEVAGACEAIARLKQAASTKHLPVLAFAEEDKEDAQAAARAAGATLVVSASGLLPQLKELLDQALEVV
jgi:CheY-like chemotaxis protein